MKSRGRPRKDNRLPKYVYLRSWGYVLARTKPKYTEIKLCGPDAPLSEVWECYEAEHGKRTDTLQWLCEQYLASPTFAKRAERTQSDYRACYESLMGRGKNATIPYARITPGMIRKYLDKGVAEHRAVRANREVAFISLVYSWAYERDMLGKGFINPCLKVRRNQEEHRKRYVTDEAYELVKALVSPWYIAPMMEFAYLCRMRKIEVLELKRSDKLREGVQVRRRKGSRDATTTWSPRLTAAWDTAIQNRQGSSLYLFHDANGERLNMETFNTAWQRLMGRALKQGLSERFTFHDLKAKGVSDFEGDKKAASGHRSERMVTVYDRKPLMVESTR